MDDNRLVVFGGIKNVNSNRFFNIFVRGANTSCVNIRLYLWMSSFRNTMLWVGVSWRSERSGLLWNVLFRFRLLALDVAGRCVRCCVRCGEGRSINMPEAVPILPCLRLRPPLDLVSGAVLGRFFLGVFLELVLSFFLLLGLPRRLVAVLANGLLSGEVDEACHPNPVLVVVTPTPID
jgi:hypothetical protein